MYKVDVYLGKCTRVLNVIDIYGGLGKLGDWVYIGPKSRSRDHVCGYGWYMHGMLSRTQAVALVVLVPALVVRRDITILVVEFAVIAMVN